MSKAEKYVLDVCMLGPRGAGKTSLLASMYAQYTQVIGATDLDLTPVGDTAVKLSDAVAVLESLSRSVQVRDGVAGTERIDLHRYDIGVGRKNKNPRFTLRFTDYAGELLRDLSSEAVGQKVRRTLQDSQVIVLAVDAPALVARDGLYHHRINQPHLMYERIKEILREDHRPRLLVVTPLKGEKYLAGPHGAKELAEQVRAGYQPLFAHLAHPEIRPRIGCVLVPVQTTGSIVFSSTTESQDGTVQFHYRSRSPGAPYRPVDTDQPLRYALRFVINVYRRERRGTWREMMEQAFRTDRALEAAIAQFTAGTRTGAGIQVLQDHPYLHPANHG
ncbi:hypothetical protein ACFYT4_01950 [Streptomyces sp. NPDC004609]|uniref:TRAFAC clade GTPase domain-containing protein n=1 Tax=Streptomyces sp. NPDC004609 TaxID=3364704 RepID=UPI0036749B5C